MEKNFLKKTKINSAIKLFFYSLITKLKLVLQGMSIAMIKKFEIKVKNKNFKKIFFFKLF